jgi:hypothetical protein
LNFELIFHLTFSFFGKKTIDEQKLKSSISIMAAGMFNFTLITLNNLETLTITSRPSQLVLVVHCPWSIHTSTSLPSLPK